FLTRFAARLLPMMSSGWQSGKPSTSIRRRQASSKCSIPSGESLQSSNERRVVCWSLIDEEIGVLRRVGKAEQDRSRLADEEVADAVRGENVTDLFGLPIH